MNIWAIPVAATAHAANNIPIIFKSKSYTVAYPTPNVIGNKVNWMLRLTDWLYSTNCTINTKGIQANFDNW